MVLLYHFSIDVVFFEYHARLAMKCQKKINLYIFERFKGSSCASEMSIFVYIP